MTYNEQTLAQISVINVTPNGNEGAIWMAGDGLAADANANIYFLDANGLFDTNLTVSGFPITSNYGNAFRSEVAIWMAGDGLAADANANIYFLDANGLFDTNLTVSGFPITSNYGNAF